MWYISLSCRDIKPENIILDKDGHCKLADVGTAKLGIFPGMLGKYYCGTLPYTAPEVIMTYFECDIMGGQGLTMGCSVVGWVEGWMDFKCDYFIFF
jgi:serine/threonine protein kinase